MTARLFNDPRTFNIGSHQRLACLADGHGNVAALDAVLASPEFATADAVAFLGCMTTGPEPDVVMERCEALAIPCFFLAGNGERNVIELAGGREDLSWLIGRWIVEHHSSRAVAALRDWPETLVADVVGLGGVRLVHGSPRSDVELLTPATPPERITAATRDVAEDVIVHGHTHLQYDRLVAGRRVVGCGSVGLPYTSAGFGAEWTLLGPDVIPVRTVYDLEEARRRIIASDYPSAQFLETLEAPFSPEAITKDAEKREFSD